MGPTFFEGQSLQEKRKMSILFWLRINQRKRLTTLKHEILNIYNLKLYWTSVFREEPHSSKSCLSELHNACKDNISCLQCPALWMHENQLTHVQQNSPLTNMNFPIRAKLQIGAKSCRFTTVKQPIFFFPSINRYSFFARIWKRFET